MSKISELLENAGDLEKSLRDLEKQVSALQTRKANLESDNVSLQNKKSDLTTQVSNLEATIAAEVNKATAAKLDEMNNEHEGLKNDRAKTNAQAGELTGKENQLKERLKICDNGIKNNEQLAATLADKNKDADQLKARLLSVIETIKENLK